MNLGLDQLTDDQWLALLQQILEDGARRDPIVREIAQATIIAESEKLDAIKEGIQMAVELAKAAEIEAIHAEVCEALKSDLSDPTVRLCSAQEEADAVAKATLTEKIAMARRAISEFQSGNVGSLRFEIHGSMVRLDSGPGQFEMVSHLDPARLRELGHLMLRTINT